MSDYEPTPEAVEAALRTREFVAGAAFGIPADAMERAATAALTAAGPLIEREVRERVAAEIEAFEPEDRALVHVPDWREAMEDAADIARGATDAAPWNHPGHRPVQHRDRQPPWCRECGWTSPQAAVPARQIKTGAPDD